MMNVQISDLTSIERTKIKKILTEIQSILYFKIDFLLSIIKKFK